MRKKLPIGVDVFSELVDSANDYLVVDKTKMIARVVDEGSKVTLITRPRRWGKTLNFSMLQHFFAAEVGGKPTAGMFDGSLLTKLENAEKYMAEQGKYPVIFITFKEVKEASFDESMQDIRDLICVLYQEHRYLLNSAKLHDDEKHDIRNFLQKTVESVDLRQSLKRLSGYLSKHTGQPVYIFIDEYDAPVMAAHQYDKAREPKGYLDLMTLFMRNFLSAGLKGNLYLKKGFMTGVLRISHNEMLSGLNNPKVRGVLDDEKYAQFYGFTEKEVKKQFKGSGLFSTDEALKKGLEAAKAMYNGYEVKGITLYNPWSINNHLESGDLVTYWVNTGDDSLVKAHALRGEDTQAKFSDLIQGKKLKATITPHIRFDALEAGQDGVWTLMLYAGYLKPVNPNPNGTFYDCELAIPNKEVFYLYRDIFIEWFKESHRHNYQSFLESVAQGNVSQFIQDLNTFMLGVSSFRDFTDEGHYHTFVLGLLCSLMQSHLMLSNKEAGAGEVDVMMVPKKHDNRLAVILEFKHVKLGYLTSARAKRKTTKDLTHEERIEKLQASAREGIDQAFHRDYRAELVNHPHITRVMRVGIAFLGKMVGAYYKEVNLQTNKVGEEKAAFPTVDDILAETREESALKRARTAGDVSSATQTTTADLLVGQGTFSSAPDTSSQAGGAMETEPPAPKRVRTAGEGASSATETSTAHLLVGQGTFSSAPDTSSQASQALETEPPAPEAYSQSSG